MKNKNIIMQMALAVALLAGAWVPEAAAQSTVRFANNLSSALTNGADGLRLPVGMTHLVSLHAGPVGSSEAALVLVGGPIGITGQPGLYNGGNVSVPGLIAGQSIALQVRAWDSQGGTITTYAAALASPSTPKGKGPIYSAPGGSTNLPPTGFTACPSGGLAMTCPASMNVPANTNAGTTTITYTTPTAALSCGTAKVTCNPPSGGAQTNGSSITHTCTATDSSGNSVSCTFVVSVGTPPLVTQQPAGSTVAKGAPAAVAAQVAGTSPLKYQWTLNSQAIAGATNATLAIPSASETNEGNYVLTVSNAFGVASSQPAALSVLQTAMNGLLIPTNAFWRYRFDGSDQGTAWRATNYNDNAWPGGPAKLGFGDGDEATIIGALANHFVTAYFRRSFLVSDPAALGSGLTFQLRRDDGAVVYLNGAEIFRSNMAPARFSCKSNCSR